MEYWSKEEARRYLTSYHGFGSFPKGDKGINEVFGRIQTIQIDPLNICGRNHELVLQSRIPEFTPEQLYNHLYSKRTLVEGWEKQAAIYRTEDWPYFKRRRKGYTNYIREHDRGRQLQDVLPIVLDELKNKGSLDSTQIEHDEVVDWRWAPAKAARAALDALLDMGKIIIVNRNSNRKVYDLVEKTIPEHILKKPDPYPNENDYNRFRIHRRVKTVGMVWEKSGQAWLDTVGAEERKTFLAELCDTGEIMAVTVEGLNSTCYIPKEGIQFHTKPLNSNKTVFLAPLDNMIWDRKFIKELFDFDFTWEVYKPANTRQYGYYILPVLSGTRFVGRIEPVLHRNPGKTVTGYRKKRFDGTVLEIKGWWPESDINMNDEIVAGLRNTLKRFGRFLGAEYIVTRNREMKKIIDKIGK